MSTFATEFHFFSNIIRQKRHERNLTQEKMAEIVGCHPNAIGRIERGRQKPSLLMVFKIAKALKISPKDLMPDLKK